MPQRISIVFILLLTSLLSNLSIQALSDTSKKVVLASNDNNNIRTAASGKMANVIFPAVLEKDAEKAIPYIEKFSVNRRAYLIRMYTRSKRFFPKIHAILKKYEVPTEFAILMALESAFNANAVSKAGAVGYWQIMDEVAKEYGLRIVEDQHLKKSVVAKNNASAKKGVGAKKTITADDRKNFTKSTYTAAKYLKARMRNLDNNWLLIAASYNWGVGNVWNAMAASGKKNPSYWDIQHRLPSETKSYVMNFITLNVIFKNYDKFINNSLRFKAEKPSNDLQKAEKQASVASL
jgi:soluble lytic murein transglycosylase-like protein